MGLLKPPEVSLNSNLEGTINGFLPFQVEAYHKLKDLDAGLMLMDTGTGKTICATGILKYHIEYLKDIDYCIVAVKNHNKINFQRMIKEFGGLNSTIIDGP